MDCIYQHGLASRDNLSSVQSNVLSWHFAMDTIHGQNLNFLRSNDSQREAKVKTSRLKSYILRQLLCYQILFWCISHKWSKWYSSLNRILPLYNCQTLICDWGNALCNFVQSLSLPTTHLVMCLSVLELFILSHRTTLVNRVIKPSFTTECNVSTRRQSILIIRSFEFFLSFYIFCWLLLFRAIFCSSI